jgi:hypothetical protein
MKIREPFSVYSNIIFLIPLYFSFYNELYIHAVLIFLVFISSIFFHTIKPIGAVWWNDTERLTTLQKIALWKDTIFASCLVIFNLFVFWQKSFPIEFYYAMAIFLFGLGFFFSVKKEHYDFSQGIWHILVGIATIFAI